MTPRAPRGSPIRFERLRYAKPLLLAVSLLVSFAAGELILRLVGFSYRESPVKLDFGFIDLDATKTVYSVEDELLWVPVAYESKLREFDADPPSLVFSGDSCTQFGTYGERLVERLLQENPGVRIRHANMGVGAWGTYQGRVQLERDIAPWRPRVITIYFGWNDHWLGLGDRAVALATRVRASPLYPLRWLQLLTRGYISLLDVETRTPRRRVPIDEFEGNLRAMVRSARGAGALPMLLTAPTSYQLGKTPPFLRPSFVGPDDDVVLLHNDYADRVRSVARETGAPLCDLLKRFGELPRRQRKASFKDDGVHLRPGGDARLARFLHECFVEHDVVSLLLDGE